MLRQATSSNKSSTTMKVGRLGLAAGVLLAAPVLITAARLLKSSRTVASSAQQPFPSITVQEANKLHKSGYTYLDVRTEEEFAAGHAPKAICAPVNIKDADGKMVPNPKFRDLVKTLLPNKGTNLVVGCRSGVRSKAASHILVELGYKSVSDVEGGWTAWAAAGLPSEK